MEELVFGWENVCIESIERDRAFGNQLALQDGARCLSGWRKQTAPALRQLASLPDFPTPSPCQATWWLLGKTAKLEPQTRDFGTELTGLALRFKRCKHWRWNFLK